MTTFLRQTCLGIIVSSFITFSPTSPLLAAPTALPGGTLYYSSQSEFETAHPGLPKEDFEESTVPAASTKGFEAPLDSTTDIAGAFAPGDILPGLRIQTAEGERADSELLVVGAVAILGNINNASIVVGANYFLDTVDILFPGGGVKAVGMDILLHNFAANINITIYGTGGNILDTHSTTIQTTETFAGFSSTAPISRIHLASPSNQGEFVDNIQFSSVFPWPMFLPGIISNTPVQNN